MCYLTSLSLLACSSSQFLLLPVSVNDLGSTLLRFGVMRCLCCLMMSRLTYTTAPSSAFPLPSDCSACVSPCRTMPRSLLLHCHGCIPSIGIYYKKHPLNWRWKVVFHEFVDSNIDRELHQVSANFSQLLNAQSIWSSTFHKGITDSSTHSTTINHHISAHSLDRRRIREWIRSSKDPSQIFHPLLMSRNYYLII